MKVVTEKVARKMIKNEENLVVIHSKDSCPVCEYFLPEILEPMLTKHNLKFVVIKEKLTFPVQAHPVTFFYKNGKCLHHPQGSAPAEAIEKMIEAMYGKSV